MTEKQSRRRRGFTLAEVLVAIGILSILMAVAVPNVISMRDDMERIELDDTARQIFTVAQNRLLALRNSGQMDALPGSQMTRQPQDYPGDGIAWDEEFYYLTKTNAALLLPPGSIDDVVRGNYYVIEYHRPSGMVYGVFYAKTLISYPEGAPRGSSERKGGALGYYGGASIQYSPPPIQTERAQVEVQNGERLALLVRAEAGTSYRVAVTGTRGEAAAYEFAFDHNSYEMAVQRYPGQFSWHYESGQAVYELLLDGAPGEARFRALFPELTPGADIEITVEATRASEAGEGLSSKISQRVNSLFASQKEGTALLAAGRHLQNLSPEFSGLSGVTAAQMIDDIRWTHRGAFLPIRNSELVAFDGAGLAIRDLSIGVSNGYAGLFARWAGELTGVHLVNGRLSAPRADCAGLLIGLAEPGSVVTNCYATIEAGETLEDYGLTGGRYVGGLIGDSRGATLQNCLAAIPQITAAQSGGVAGGLLGRMEGGSLQGCYAAGGWVAESGYQGGVSAPAAAGGLIGQIAGGRITDCYAVGMVGGEGLLAALLGEVSGEVIVQNTYAAVLCGDGGAVFFHGDATLSNCYILYPAEEPALPEGLSAAEAEGFTPAALGGAFAAADGATTASYTLAGAYPYPRLSVLPHYGDWPPAALFQSPEPSPVGETPDEAGPGEEAPDGEEEEGGAAP